MALYLRAAWDVPFAPEPRVVAAVRHCGRRLRIEMEQSYDFARAWSVLRGGEYVIAFPPDAQIILDLGSNIGVSILDFRARSLHARICGVEPDTRAFEPLRRNVADDPAVEIGQVAVAISDGTADFYTAKTRGRRRSVRRLPGTIASRSPRGRSSRCWRTLGLEACRPLKINVEGAEGEVFESFAPLRRVRWIVGELHLELLGCTPEAFFERHLVGYDVDARVADGYCSFSAVARAGSAQSSN